MLLITTLPLLPSHGVLPAALRMKLDVGKVLQAGVLDDVSWRRGRKGWPNPLDR